MFDAERDVHVKWRGFQQRREVLVLVILDRRCAFRQLLVKPLLAILFGADIFWDAHGI